MPDKPVRMAVIGLGMASAPHAMSLVELQAEGRVEVAGCWSRSKARREAFAHRHRLPVTDDLDALLADPALDAALLLTPPDARLELVERLAASGRHILMEKPLERTSQAAARIAASCEQAGITAAVTFQHRFRESAERLRGLLAEGALGELAAVQLLVPWWRPQAYYDEPGRGTLARDGGGVLISQAIHSIDLMLSLAGQVVEVAAVAGTTSLHRMDSEDFVGAGLRFANGALGSLSATTACFPGGPERLVLSGTRGTAMLEGGSLTVDFMDGKRLEVGQMMAGGGGADPMAFPHDWHKAVLRDFLDAVQGRGVPRVDPREALHAHRLIDALLRSSREGRCVQVG
ncbi:Gfo/Idh/MocA family oxidoreductase [Geminicoccaceae bacterium 1502E]|nr:Gfo/Idh/MocA family oxidoreductase [Geminicoccaceae bacterium 1502E]